ncbi:MAG: type II toxin-antitoxin system VapC family toxin [Phycisphaera sp.]|nr:MAG: type II toxin-antitoxin system VapC family toxin [Phycisphaera sp.]
MTGFLLDTHALLWWLSDPEKLSGEARTALTDGQNSVYVSSAAGWEMAIKKRLGRLDYPANLAEVLDKDHIAVLPITLPHALAVSDLPMHHQDPFDRMMLAQAMIEGLVLVTRDDDIRKYDIKVLVA